MRKDITIAAEARTSRGKNNARRMRVLHKIPAVVYGIGKDPVAVSVSPKELNKLLQSSTGVNTIFNIDIGGVENSPVMVVDWQHDPVKGNLLHVDLQRIDLSKRLLVKVPVHTHGDAKGVKQQGGMYEMVTRDIMIECLPDEIPESFNINVTEMMLGESLRAASIPLSGSMKLVSSPDQVISHVTVMRGVVEETPAEAAAPVAGATTAEPEVIKKGKKEEEGAEKEKEKKK